MRRMIRGRAIGATRAEFFLYIRAGLRTVPERLRGPHFEIVKEG